MTGSLMVKGIARVQYVNAAAATDEWPPKYWKARSPKLSRQSLAWSLSVAHASNKSLIGCASGDMHGSLPPAVRGLTVCRKGPACFARFARHNLCAPLIFGSNAAW